MGHSDGVERPFLDGKGHESDCNVWNDFDSRFMCSCGAVTRPAPRVIPGFSNYELSVDGNVKQLSTGKVLRTENVQGVVNLVDDAGGRRVRKIIPLIDSIFRDLA